MSRQNTVEIVVKVKDLTGGLDTSKSRVKKFADEVKKDLDTIEAHGAKVGTNTGKKIAAGIEKSARPNVQLAGARAGVDFGTSFAKNAVDFLGNMKLPVGPAGLAAAAPFAAAGGALAGGVVGGLTVAGAAGGVVGLGALLLKDNEKVSDAWSKSMTRIKDNAVVTAGVLEDEFVGLAQRTSDFWFHELRPAVHGLFIEAEPLVNKFADGFENATMAFLPGLKEMTANAEPVVEGFGDFLTGIFKGAGDGLADLSQHGDSLKTTLQLAGEGIGTTLKGAIGFMGDLSDAVARNEDAFRMWGGVAKDVLKGTGLFMTNLVDLAGAVGTPNFKEMAKKFLEGNKYEPPKTHTASDSQVFGLGLKQQADAVKGLDSAMGALNEQKSKGINLSAEEISKSTNLFEMQNLLAGGAINVANSTDSANLAYSKSLSSMLEIAAAGYPVANSLLNVVTGMSDAELAAIGATVTTDALGNSIINIPGHKPITLTADASKANPPIDGVIDRMSRVQSKNVHIGVTTTYTTVVQGPINTGVRGAVVMSNKGGLIPGGGPDRDSVPALLTPGEFVVNRKATQANRDFLERLNAANGGSATFAQQGGGGGHSSNGRGGGGGGTVRIEWVGGPTSGLELALADWFMKHLRVNGGQIGDYRVPLK